MPKNPIVEAILGAGKKVVEQARRAFEGEFHTPSHSMQGIRLPEGWRRQPLPLQDPSTTVARAQQMAAEDAEVFAALDRVSVEGFDPPVNPRRRLTPADLAAMPPEERDRARIEEAAQEMQDEVDADIFRTLEAAGNHVSRGLIPGTLNIQAPMQVSRVAPGPDGHYDVNPQAQVGMLANLTREDLERVRREIEQYDLRASAQPIFVPGRMQGVMDLEDVRVNPEAVQRIIATQPEGMAVFNPRAISRLERYSESRTIERVREIGNEGLVEVLVQAGRSEMPAVEASERVMAAIRAGQHVAVSMGTRVDPGFFEPPRVRGGDPSRLRGAMRGCSVCGGDHGMMDCPRIDGPSTWVNVPSVPRAHPDEVVPGIRAERVTVPEFELAANPTVSIQDVRTRRFDIMDRGHDIGHQDYSQDIPSALRQEPHTNQPRPYCPTHWEKITGEELIGD